MFSKVVILCSVVACVFTAPSPAATDVVPLEKQQPTVIPIVSQSEELEPNGTYKFSYETGNGIKREETSYDKVNPKAQGRSADSNEGGESGESDEIHVQQGSYSYTAPDGTLISVRYIADENGFQPIGDHIPRVPSQSQDASSSGRSSKSLNIADSAGAGSVPAVAARSAAKSESAPVAEDKPKDVKPEEAKLEEPKPEAKSAEAASTAAENEATTAALAASTTEAASEATEAASTAKVSEAPAESSTTEAPKSPEEPTEVAPTEAASTEAPKAEELVSTEAPKAEADVSTVAAESTPASAEASTTEGGITTVKA